MSYDVSNSMGTISVANSSSLMTFNNQQAAEEKFVKQPMSGPPVSVNAWTSTYDQKERGIIATNLVV